MRSHAIRRSALGLTVSLWVAACGSPSPSLIQGNDRIQADYSLEGRLQRLAYDKDGDGKPDMWAYMDGTRVIRTEIDENNDGVVDRWEYHAGADDTIVRIERATRRDGKITRREFFANGQLIRVEEDTDGDGLVDKWETYVNGSLATMDIDNQHRGKPDRRLVYSPDGSFLRIEADPTGSGTFAPLHQ